MCSARMHDGEADIGVALVRRLVAAQFPQWAGLPVERVDSAGTSNAMYRLGEDMVVRLPRIAGAAGDVEKEHRWLPYLAERLPVAVPVPLGRGLPAGDYPWRWSVYRWLEGENAVAYGLPAPDGLPTLDGRPAADGFADPGLLAEGLAEFVLALRRIDSTDGPPAYRSEPLTARDEATRAAITGLRDAIDADAAAAAWEAALRAPRETGPAVWIHADLQPGNLLLHRGRLSAVIDFGCLGVGDPAVDLIPAWYVLPAGARTAFRAAVEADDAAWARGRGWALSIAVMELGYYRTTNPVMARIARHVIGEVLS